MVNADGQGQKLFDFRIWNSEDIVLARQKVRDVAGEMGFSVLDQTRIITAVSELARNIVVHAASGKMTAYKTAGRAGLTIVFKDIGPGIPDIDKAMQHEFSSVGSLGLGLQGAKRLTDKMEIESHPGKGTTIAITKWLLS